MISLEDYRKDPCGSLSLPWWKVRNFPLPADMKVVHERDFDQALLAEYRDDPYFRLYHDLRHIPESPLQGFVIRQAIPEDDPLIARTICASYPDITVSAADVKGWRTLPVFDPGLWLMVQKTGSGKAIACAIAEFDPTAREGILDWVQVLPTFRRRGIGQAMVYALLTRIKEKAAFATVTGQKKNPANPEALYRACGFTGRDVWHVLKRI